MTRYRLRIQQLTLIIRSTLHTKIIPNNQHQQADRHAALFRAFLGLYHRGECENNRSCARDEPTRALDDSTVPTMSGGG